MPSLPISALLSQTLVAFTIEFDNEVERRMPHRTTDYGPSGDGPTQPWLVSLAMWFNCLQHIGDDGLFVKELETAARTNTNLRGMQRWGYITVTRVGRQDRVRTKAAGRLARHVCPPLLVEIEERWKKRIGDEKIAGLRAGLSALVAQFDVDLPDCMPILGYALVTRRREDEHRPPPGSTDPARLPLPALLARVLTAFALEFEHGSTLSLAIQADVLRVIAAEGTLLRDLPRLGGVSKEAVAMALKILVAHKLVLVGPDPGHARARCVTLTPRGRTAQSGYVASVRAAEDSWRTRFGDRTIDDLRRALEATARPDLDPSPLFAGLTPCPECWRARVPAPTVLPHFPMVLHRGGYPDGA
jgi:DNA-binding MarR family transcriptional regulator